VLGAEAEEVNGCGGASGDEVEELGAEEFADSHGTSGVEVEELGAEEVDVVAGDGDTSRVKAEENPDEGDTPLQGLLTF
jgi:hypothetical protein